MASWENDLRKPSDIRGSSNTRPKHQYTARRPLHEGMRLSSDNWRPGIHTRSFIHQDETDNTRTRQRVPRENSSAEMKSIPPKCDSCDRETKLDCILPCEHKICGDCFTKETFMRSTANRGTEQFFISCNKHGSSRSLFAIQRVHKILFGKQSQYQGLACVGCEERIVRYCSVLKCEHFACKYCCKGGPCYCSICRKTSEKRAGDVTIAVIQQYDLLHKQVTAEPECLETKQTSDSDICSSHMKIGVSISCETTLCMECIENMAGGELVKVMQEGIDDTEHCICYCSPIRGRHIISITSLRKAAFSIPYVEEYHHGRCSQTTCDQKAIVKIRECCHALCRKCVLNDKSCFTRGNEKIYRENDVLTCGITDCNAKILLRQLNPLIVKYSADMPTTKRKCETTKQLASSSYETDLDQGGLLKRRTSIEDEKASAEIFNSPDLMATLSSDECSGTQERENPPTEIDPLSGLKEKTSSEYCSQIYCSLKDKQKNHCKSPRLHSVCSYITCMKKAEVQFSECNHFKCLDCMLKMISNGNNGKKRMCGVGFVSFCATEIPLQSLKEYLNKMKIDPLSYLKKKTSSEKCSQTFCTLKAVVEFRKCSHRMCMECVVAKISKGDIIHCGRSEYLFDCNTLVPSKIVEEYFQNYVEHNMEGSWPRYETEVCNNPNCKEKRISLESKPEILTSSESKPEILGIPNIGFTCYASCVLQVLGQTPEFKDILSKYCQGSEENHVETLLKRLLENVNVGEERYFVINWRHMEQLMSRMFQIDDSFRRYQENDCHSFIMSLLNSLTKEETRTKKNAEKDEKTNRLDSGEAFEPKENTANRMDGCRPKLEAASKNNSEASICPTALFESRLTSRFTYNNCSHEEYVDDQLFYSLLIPVWKDVRTLENGLGMFFTREKFEKSALPCRECNVKNDNTITTRSLQMSEAPKILMLQLARFEEVSYAGQYKELRKTDHPVEFKMTLNVKRDDTTEEKEMEYELYGVVLHSGSMHGGHYTSCVRKQNTNRWYYCSDSSVSELQEHVIFQQRTFRNAYVLFYSRKN